MLIEGFFKSHKEKCEIVEIIKGCVVKIKKASEKTYHYDHFSVSIIDKKDKFKSYLDVDDFSLVDKMNFLLLLAPKSLVWVLTIHSFILSPYHYKLLLADYASRKRWSSVNQQSLTIQKIWPFNKKANLHEQFFG